jgi:hypothetical protein
MRAITDTDRINWLASTEQNIGNVQLPTECVENNLSSLRDAIDSAIKIDAELKSYLK